MFLFMPSFANSSSKAPQKNDADNKKITTCVLNTFLPDAAIFPAATTSLSGIAAKKQVWVSRINADKNLKESFKQALLDVATTQHTSSNFSAVGYYVSLVRKLTTPEARVACYMIASTEHGAKSLLGSECARQILREAPSLLRNGDRRRASAFAAVVASHNKDHVTAVAALNKFRMRPTKAPRRFDNCDRLLSKALGF